MAGWCTEVVLPSELESLEKASARLADAAAAHSPALAERAHRMAERFSRHQFHVSVIGEFKRGKSTLVNALLGTDLLPTGVLPLTAVAIEISYGVPGATVVDLDGKRTPVTLGELQDYVTEACNPGNERRVQRVELTVDSDLLAGGLVIVDTPGIGSIYLHNDESARQALLDADGAILVLSADEPVSADERQLLSTLAERQAPTFFVLNKVDHLSPSELDQVRRFVEGVLSDELGRQERLWCTAALPALRARLAGSELGPEAVEFAAFFDELSHFISEGLGRARLATARAELRRIAQELDLALRVEESARSLDAETLARKVQEFRRASAREVQALEDDMVLVSRDVSQLAAAVGESLREFAAEAPRAWTAQLEHIASEAPFRSLEERLNSAVEQAVSTGFEEFRRSKADWMEKTWSDIATRYRSKTEERVNAVRDIAADLFETAVPTVDLPTVAEEPERFFYLFLHLGAPGQTFSRVVRALLPRSAVRRKLLRAATTRLADEFDKHSGRARWDLTQRLDSARRKFEAAMRENLGQTVEAILEAAERAEALHLAAEEERARFGAEEQSARGAVSAALSVADQGGENEEAL
jgi:GTPase SAR1 family protein